MVVTCPECSTKFTLDSSRIPGPTTKVRCSRCRHVFRITRDGQVVAPDLAPAAAPTQEAPPQAEAPEEIPGPAPAQPAEPWSTPEPQAAPEKAAPPYVAPTIEEMPPPPEVRRPAWWIPALLLAALALGGVSWLAWQGTLLKPVANLVQRLKGKQAPPQQPGPVAGQEAGAPAPTIVTPPPPLAPAPDLVELAVDWAQARYQGLLNDKGGGQMLLIQGEVINKGKSPRGPIRLKAILTDAQHRPLREEVVYAGTTLSETEAKTLSPEEIKGWLAKPGGRSQELVLKPGEKEPFTVVFFGVPGNLAEIQYGFQLVVLEGPVAH